MIGEYAKSYEHNGGPQAFFMLAQDAVDVLAGKQDAELLVSDKQAAGAIGIIAALMDVRVSVDGLTAAVRELVEEVSAQQP